MQAAVYALCSSKADLFAGKQSKIARHLLLLMSYAVMLHKSEASGMSAWHKVTPKVVQTGHVSHAILA